MPGASRSNRPAFAAAADPGRVETELAEPVGGGRAERVRRQVVGKAGESLLELRGEGVVIGREHPTAVQMKRLSQHRRHQLGRRQVQALGQDRDRQPSVERTVAVVLGDQLEDLVGGPLCPVSAHQPLPGADH